MKKEKKQKKDLSKIFLMVLTGLLIANVVLIPLYILAEVKGKIGILLFIVFPLFLLGMVVYLSRNCLKSYNTKKKVIEEKLRG